MHPLGNQSNFSKHTFKILPWWMQILDVWWFRKKITCRRHTLPFICKILRVDKSQHSLHSFSSHPWHFWLIGLGHLTPRMLLTLKWVSSGKYVFWYVASNEQNQHKTKMNLLLCILERAKSKSVHKDDLLLKNVAEPKTQSFKRSAW